MVSFKEAGKMLDKAMEELPRGIFDGLNGGVNLLEEPRRDAGGAYILGLYHNNIMGRYIELFYGSFTELYGDIPPVQFERRLRSTLHHELTHHIEGLAGDRSLERWDEEQALLWQEEPEELFAESILFLDDDDCSLAPAAKALFAMFAARRCPDISCQSAGIFSAGKALQPDCLGFARALGADFSSHRCKMLDAELFNSYDAVLCMTLAQTDELLERFPGSEQKLMCIDDRDILRPKLRHGWKKCVERLWALADEYSSRLIPEAPCPEGISLLRLDGSAGEERLEAMERLERQNFSTPWTKDMLLRALERENCCFFAAEENGKLLGYIGAQLVLDELEIFNIAVDGAQRRRHIGDMLVEALCARAEEMAARRITLEVRSSNAPAIALYKKHGFEQVGLRKNYYEKPREDAILMDLVL